VYRKTEKEERRPEIEYLDRVEKTRKTQPWIFTWPRPNYSGKPVMTPEKRKRFEELHRKWPHAYGPLLPNDEDYGYEGVQPPPPDAFIPLSMPDRIRFFAYEPPESVTYSDRQFARKEVAAVNCADVPALLAKLDLKSDQYPRGRFLVLKRIGYYLEAADLDEQPPFVILGPTWPRMSVGENPPPCAFYPLEIIRWWTVEYSRMVAERGRVKSDAERIASLEAKLAARP
jgi:hypothetical protein